MIVVVAFTVCRRCTRLTFTLHEYRTGATAGEAQPSGPGAVAGTTLGQLFASVAYLTLTDIAAALLPPWPALIEINCIHINDYGFLCPAPSLPLLPCPSPPLFLSVELLSMDYSAPWEPWDVTKCRKQSIPHIVLGLAQLCSSATRTRNNAS